MHDHSILQTQTCTNCGSTRAHAAADARAVGVALQFQAGMYSCCEVVLWADEQWIAWKSAAEEDGKCAEEATRILEVSEPDPALPVPVLVRKGKSKSASGHHLK